MQKHSAALERRIDELAHRHRFSREAVSGLLDSILRGYGSMAQFDHPELGGSGQWMRGGMIMVSDMSDSTLKGRVAALAADLAALAADDAAGHDAAPAQGARAADIATDDALTDQGAREAQDEALATPPVSLFVPPAHEASRHWWPAALGTPSSTGSQNSVRYAYFEQARCLAIELNGHLTVYDTLDHQLGSFSQAQSDSSSLSFHSQHGLIELAQLPIVSESDERTG